MNNNIFEEVKELMIDELGIDPETITPASAIATDLNINSLELMNVIVATEEKYDITLDEQALSKVRTVGDFVSCIEVLIS